MAIELRFSSLFTGKERDTESGNDYFGARYYNSATGRWLSPDWSAKIEPVPYAKLDDPQSLNLYGYVLNNPLSHLDTDGHQCDTCKRFMNWVSAHTYNFGREPAVHVAAPGTPAPLGPLMVNVNVGTGQLPGVKGSISPVGANISSQTHATVAEITANSKHSNTQINDLTFNANASGTLGAAGNAFGLQGSAGAHLDVLSGNQTFTFGPVSLKLTGEVGFGAQAGGGIANTGASWTAGAAFGAGGAYTINVDFGAFTSTAGASGTVNSTKITTDRTVSPVNQH